MFGLNKQMSARLIKNIKKKQEKRIPNDVYDYNTPKTNENQPNYGIDEKQKFHQFSIRLENLMKDINSYEESHPK